MKAYIHSFESLAALDGDGLRYAVFLNHCPLRCVYCHNPDTWLDSGACLEASELVKKISRYKPYFKSGGGVTFSGGEPLLQADFICECSELLQKEGVGYALDTSGAVDITESVRQAVERSELVILDLKFPDDAKYKKYTGVGIAKVLNMLELLEKLNKKTLLRTVIVPGINDTEEQVSKYAEIAKRYKCISNYELLAFHTMGFFKYRELGIENPLENTQPLPEEKRAELQEYLNELLKTS